MSKIIEDLIHEYKKEWAIGIIKTGKLSYEEIAECLRLDIDEIKNLVWYHRDEASGRINGAAFCIHRKFFLRESDSGDFRA